MFPRLRSWFRAASHRSRLEREMSDELAFHLENYTQDLIARGIDSEEAARRARIELGSIATQKERMRGSLGLRLWDDLRADLRHAIRILAKSPGFTAVAIGSLALGIGANTAIFSMTRTALFENLPVPQAGELRQLHWTIHGMNQPMNSSYGVIEKTPAAGMSSPAFSTAAYQNLRQSTVFQDLIAYFNTGRMEISFNGDADSGSAEYVSGNFFTALGMKPEAGRLLLPSDDTATGKSNAVVLSDLYWKTRFARSPAAIGKTLEVNRVPLTIVGVAPQGFTSFTIYEWPRIFVPVSMEPILSPVEGRSRFSDPETWWLSIFGRIQPGISDTQAQAALAGIFRQTVHETLTKRRDVDLDTMRLTVSLGNHGDNPWRHRFLETDSILSALAFLVLLLAPVELAFCGNWLQRTCYWLCLVRSPAPRSDTWDAMSHHACSASHHPILI